MACFRDHKYGNIAPLCMDGTCPPIMDLLLDTVANSMAWHLQLHKSETIWLFLILCFGSHPPKSWDSLCESGRWEVTREEKPWMLTQTEWNAGVFQLRGPLVPCPQTWGYLDSHSISPGRLTIHVPKVIENNFTILCDLNFAFSWNYTMHSMSEGK